MYNTELKTHFLLWLTYSGLPVYQNPPQHNIRLHEKRSHFRFIYKTSQQLHFDDTDIRNIHFKTSRHKQLLKCPR